MLTERRSLRNWPSTRDTNATMTTALRSDGRCWRFRQDMVLLKIRRFTLLPRTERTRRLLFDEQSELLPRAGLPMESGWLLLASAATTSTSSCIPVAGGSEERLTWSPVNDDNPDRLAGWQMDAYNLRIATAGTSGDFKPTAPAPLIAELSALRAMNWKIGSRIPRPMENGWCFCPSLRHAGSRREDKCSASHDSHASKCLACSHSRCRIYQVTGADFRRTGRSTSTLGRPTPRSSPLSPMRFLP